MKGAGQTGFRSQKKTTKYKNKNMCDVCCVCLVAIECCKKMQLHCGHLFHGACLCTWLAESHVTGACPICRCVIAYDASPDVSAPPARYPFVLTSYYLARDTEGVSVVVSGSPM